MGFLDTLLGRTKPSQPNLDRLFGLSGARLTLEAAEGLVPSLEAGVCFKPATGQDFASTEKEFNDLLGLGDGGSLNGTSAKLSDSSDSFGYRWVVLRSDDFDSLVTSVHLVNSTLQDHGWGPTLLCSVFWFHPGTDAARPDVPAHLFLVYLYKRGAFYPFAPNGPEKRDSEVELRLKTELANDLTVEGDLDRWFPLWELPVS
ncbi:MAG TPA: hypothetical protein VG368_04835 [Acidimicrobiales bacterium]|jgi:hypothetical protein|nr:hypothetical protein [Acidimicrobiales bacterium]